jgi:hypothetical protein
MASKDVEIVPTGGGWHVVVPGKPRSAGDRVFKTKREAVNYARTSLHRRSITGIVTNSAVGAFRATVKKAGSGRRVTTMRGKSAKRTTPAATPSPRAEAFSRVQAEYDRSGAPGNEFRDLIKAAALKNEAALNRLAK